jgi:MinD-like ATPase involved in chromosome partitioning or flagellar assembly
MSGMVVIGAAGGCGVTTTACALALLLADRGVNPLLVDADLHGGGPASMWSLDAARGLDDLRALGHEVGADHVAHLVHRHACGVDLMAGCSSASSPVAHDPVPCEAVAAHAASRACWVADCGRGDSALAAALMARAGIVVALVPCTMHGAARGGAWASHLDGPRVSGAMARWVAGEQVPERVLLRALGWPDAIVLGRDDRAARDVAAARAPRGRGLARSLLPLVETL